MRRPRSRPRSRLGRHDAGRRPKELLGCAWLLVFRVLRRRFSRHDRASDRGTSAQHRSVRSGAGTALRKAAHGRSLHLPRSHWGQSNCQGGGRDTDVRPHPSSPGWRCRRATRRPSRLSPTTRALTCRFIAMAGSGCACSPATLSACWRVLEVRVEGGFHVRAPWSACGHAAGGNAVVSTLSRELLTGIRSFGSREST